MIGVTMTAAAAAQIRRSANIDLAQAGSLYGYFDGEAGEVRVVEATSHTEPGESVFALVGGWWATSTVIGERPQIDPEQAAEWAGYLDDQHPVYAAVVITPGSEPSRGGFAEPQATAWIARTVGESDTAVDAAPLKFLGSE